MMMMMMMIHKVFHCRQRRANLWLMYRKLREIWTCGFCDMRADRQTDRHVHRNTSHPYRGRSENLRVSETAKRMFPVYK